MNLGEKIPYSKAKHQDLYNQLLQLYKAQKRESEFWNYLYSCLTQFSPNENIFSGYDEKNRIELLERLKQKLSDQCDLSFKLETTKYINYGWNEFIVTLICRKL